MATDPVERIRAFEHETPLSIDLNGTLKRLAAAPPSTVAPYLTVCLDWRPEGTEPGRTPPPELKRSQRRELKDVAGTPWRPSWEAAYRELGDLVNRYAAHSAAFESLSADVERIKTYIENDLNPVAQGVIVVACDRQGVFEPAALDIPVTTDIVVGTIPSLRQLVAANEDFPLYAVLVADQRDAFLWLLERRNWAWSVQLEADGYPRHQQQGGWSQKRFQARAGERVDAFAKAIADEVRQELVERETQVPYLIVAAEEPMATALDNAFHESVKERVIGRVNLAPEANAATVAAATEPLVAQTERQREREAVQAVHDGVGAAAKGVAGPEDTLTALQGGQVLTLVMNDDYSQAGWADYTFPLFGAGKIPAQHPAGGDHANIVRTDVAEEAIRLAIQSDAAIEIVKTAVPVSQEEVEVIPAAEEPIPRSEAATALDALGGIGAVLRFALDAGQPTAEL
jgi:peptide subunit release factor 1 (eRF1)